MKYLLIENKGEIHPLALILMGASDKRDDKTKIGHYGSGNKYALALLLRLGIPFRIFAGEHEITVHTEPVQVKTDGPQFDRIYLMFKGERIETSLTIQMGPQWLPWFVVREIYCNALDEGGCNVVPMVSEIMPTEGKTRFYIGVNEHIEPVIANWNTYFTQDRIDLFETLPGVRIFMRKDKGIRVYRKGILVHQDEAQSAIFDYDMDEAQINESRVLEGTWRLQTELQAIIGIHGTPELIKRLLLGIHLHELENKNNHLLERNMTFEYAMTHNKDAWKEAIKGFQFVNASVTGRYAEEVQQQNTLVLPSGLLHAMQESLDSELPAHGIARKGSSHSYKKYEPTEDQLIVLNNAVVFLTKAGYDFEGINIKIVNFDSPSTLGGVDRGNKTIYVGTRAFDLGTKMVANTICEEHMHLTTGYRDESRELQNYLYDKLMNEYEHRTGIYL